MPGRRANDWAWILQTPATGWQAKLGDTDQAVEVQGMRKDGIRVAEFFAALPALLVGSDPIGVKLALREKSFLG
jgi:hypothetical protein